MLFLKQITIEKGQRDQWCSSVSDLNFHLRHSLRGASDSFIKDSCKATCQSSGVTQAPSQTCPTQWRDQKKRGCHLGTLKLRKRKNLLGKEQRAHSKFNPTLRVSRLKPRWGAVPHSCEQPGQVWKRFKDGKVLLKEGGSAQLSCSNRDSPGQRAPLSLSLKTFTLCLLLPTALLRASKINFYIFTTYFRDKFEYNIFTSLMRRPRQNGEETRQPLSAIVKEVCGEFSSSPTSHAVTSSVLFWTWQGLYRKSHKLQIEYTGETRCFQILATC